METATTPTTETNPTFNVGDAVQIIEIMAYLASAKRLICTGNVERLTKTLIIVRNQYGNVSKFRKTDNKIVGYSWPYITDEIRKA